MSNNRSNLLIVLGSKKVETFPWPTNSHRIFGIVRREKTVVLFYLGSYDGPFSASLRLKQERAVQGKPDSRERAGKRECGTSLWRRSLEGDVTKMASEKVASANPAAGAGQAFAAAWRIRDVTRAFDVFEPHT